MVERSLADGGLLDRTAAWVSQSQLSHYLRGGLRQFPCCASASSSVKWTWAVPSSSEMLQPTSQGWGGREPAAPKAVLGLFTNSAPPTHVYILASDCLQMSPHLIRRLP